MLVLSRKRKEVINVGNNVVIKILRIKGNSVQIGIEAPIEVKVLRGELDENENETALDFEWVEVVDKSEVKSTSAETPVQQKPLGPLGAYIKRT